MPYKNAADKENLEEEIEASVGQQSDLQHIEDVVHTGEGDDGPEESNKRSAQSKRQV